MFYLPILQIMADLKTQYTFKLEDQRQEVFILEIDDRSLEINNIDSASAPAWAKLETHQCPHCPLKSDTHPNCPVAVNLSSVIERFDNVYSDGKVELEVVTSERIVTQSTTVQRSIGSLIGLLIATSGCPYTTFFKPMARFHLPLSTEEDTILRAVGVYLIAQYFLSEQGKESDMGLGGLKKIYDNMHVVNSNIAKRIRSATATDSSVNAVILLDMFTNLMPYVIEEKLDDIRHLFDSYLN